MTQTLAILLDAYRELNSRKLFWITMVLSGLFACVLLAIGISEIPDADTGEIERRFRVLLWDTPIPLSAETTLEVLLKAWFVSLGIGLWLTWAATILALISTAGVFPNLVTSGSIDLALSKPISRLRLFLTVYASGLMFVTLQVSAFTVLSFLIIGVRAGAWEFGLLLAIPIVVAFFSYLFSVCALIGVITRSTIAALLVTILFWLLLFGLNFTDEILSMPHAASEVHVEMARDSLQTARESEDSPDATIERLQSSLDAAEESLQFWDRWHGMIVTVKTALPKTAETIELLNRWLVPSANLPADNSPRRDEFPFISEAQWQAGVRPHHVINRAQEYVRERSVAWVIGTSLLFELVLVAFGAWRFCRRDF